MSLDTTTIERLPHVKAALNFILPSAEKPLSYEYDPPIGVPRMTAAYEARTVPIHNMRPIAGGFSLEREGVQLINAPTQVEDFCDERQIRRFYYPEAERLVRELTGASRVVIFDVTIRQRIPGVSDRSTGWPRRPPVPGRGCPARSTWVRWTCRARPPTSSACSPSARRSSR